MPVFRNGRPNPAAFRQISAGSILGGSPSVEKGEGSGRGREREDENAGPVRI